MPTVELMGWNKDQRRWFKDHRGKMHSVSPRQLKTEPTKEASRQAANDWWTKKQAEVDEKLAEANGIPPNSCRTTRLPSRTTACSPSGTENTASHRRLKERKP